MRFGVLGVGNMGEAILRGALAGRALQATQVTVYDIAREKSEALARELGIHSAESLEALAQCCDTILFAVKPNVIGRLLDQHRALFRNKAVLSIIAGWSCEKLSDNLPNDTRILRAMPNTPAMVGEGMIVFEDGDSLTDEEKAFANTLFGAVGQVTTLEPVLMDAVTAVSGSGPAYIYILIEAMADAGVQQGLPRAVAYELAAQTVLGSARMVLETGKHPGELKDNVCSPGGTTIDAVARLEQCGFRSAIIEAVEVCAKKSKAMSNNI